ncbi:hypothetical protein LTR36_006634 [Oleoguttula mirabilis]|uniref:DUF3047 domain-containing protein n=1 Tax=Oleoguttula mirabilis TaxID=1507867 RepID=A0AAV9JBY0_9PEZI|nr:hypothetical protein LTR36_006634 [Oleoguttula mirabilis]
MASLTWQAANGATVPPDTTATFKVSAPPKTDIWRRSEADDVFNAPYIYTTMRPAAFNRISVTVSGPWKTQFDQGGLVLAFPRHDGPTRWIKAGIEFFHGKPCLGVVGNDRFSDWSICPMAEGETKATFEAVKDGHSLWIYAVKEGEKQPLREVKWAFIDYLDEQKQYEDMRVGVYVAKPTPDEGDTEATIQASFADLQVDRDH